MASCGDLKELLAGGLISAFVCVHLSRKPRDPFDVVFSVLGAPHANFADIGYHFFFDR